VLEANIAIATGVKAYLSPQYLLNCDSKDAGCNGGAFPNTFSWVQANGHLLDSVLPYTNAAGTCDSTLTPKANAHITGYNYCSPQSTLYKCSENVVYSLLQKGPLNVGIDASGDDFQSYASGVFTGACSASNHAVIMAGYGLDSATNKQYWLIRNSWGTTWGMNGYIKIFRNDANNNSCFTVQEAWIPTLN